MRTVPAIVQILDEVTVGVVIRSDSVPATVDMVEQHLQTVRPRCLVVDMSGGPAASPELARAVARLLEARVDAGSVSRSSARAPRSCERSGQVATS
jgi:hypothetical protein